MRKIILAVLFLFCANVFSQTHPNTCSSDALPAGQGGGGGGGVVVFPWSSARPFPWTSIQGVWAVASATNSQNNLVFEFRVTRSTEKSKQLFVQIYELDNCKKSYMRGVGIVNSTEKNVVRINMNNVLMKVALFKTTDLEMDTHTCGPKALGVYFYRLMDNHDAEIKSKTSDIPNKESANMLLRKVPNAEQYRCKK